jgi:HEAT repeat protein/cyclophilin family peptidyl-prolyl cis-trans isomerase
MYARVLLAVAVTGAAACATAPPVAPPPPTYGEKVGWILQLEDQRILREPAPEAPAEVAGTKLRSAPQPPPRPDLGRLVVDEEARVRRRAALAVGRVGLPAGVDLLVARLSDPEPEVRQMAAFALGLIGDRRAVEPLTAALSDPSPLVQGRAAEALGMIGDRASAPAIATMLESMVRSGSLGPVPERQSEPGPEFDAFRLGVYAETRLRAFDELARVVLDGNGQPVVKWWPVAYALGRMPDRRALPALLTFARDGSQVARIFAARGLGELRDASAVDVLLPQVESWQRDLPTAIAAVRALGQIGGVRAVAPIVTLLAGDTPPNLRLEAVNALGAMHAEPAVVPLLDCVADPWPPMRAASLAAVRTIDLQQFILVLSTLEPDADWSVRAATASVISTLPADIALTRLTEMLKDSDDRVIAQVLAALVKLGAQTAPAVLYERLKAADPIVRAAAAAGVGELKPPEGAEHLVEAYGQSQAQTDTTARVAILNALSKYGAEAARPSLHEALADRDWSVRLKAAALLAGFEPSFDAADAIRPAPTRPIDYASPELASPDVSPHVYIETDKGTIEFELAVLEAPLTSQSFVSLARSGFFTGIRIHRVVPNFVVQDGDPRGDGEGGPGYTIRDELNQRPYLRGTVGMALDGPDTGGSQFFITEFPQPHLDARYTVFGQVVNGFDVLDRLQQWDVIRHVRVWDGKQWTGK